MLVFLSVEEMYVYTRRHACRIVDAKRRFLVLYISNTI
jgi:hypothetical protein